MAQIWVVLRIESRPGARFGAALLRHRPACPLPSSRVKAVALLLREHPPPLDEKAALWGRCRGEQAQRAISRQVLGLGPVKTGFEDMIIAAID